MSDPSTIAENLWKGLWPANRSFYVWALAVVLTGLFLVSKGAFRPELKAMLFEIIVGTAAIGWTAYAFWWQFRIDVSLFLFDAATSLASLGQDLDGREARRIEHHLERALSLSASGRARLRAHLNDRFGHPPTIEEVRRGVRALPEADRRRLGKLLMTIVAAAEQGNAEQGRTLVRNALQALNIDPQDLRHDLERKVENENEASTVDLFGKNGKAGSTSVGENRDPQRTGARENRTPEQEGLHLDEDRISEIQAETRDAARVLQGVFADEEGTVGEDPSRELSPKCASLISDLAQQLQWSQDEFEELAEEHGFMPGRARERVNELAYEKAGEPLLEEENPVQLNSHALDRLTP